jgi:hypothetical protein
MTRQSHYVVTQLEGFYKIVQDIRCSQSIVVASCKTGWPDEVAEPAQPS